MIKSIYLNNIYMFYYYLENNSIYLSSVNNNKKIRESLQIILLYNKSQTVKKYSLFKLYLNKNKYFNTYLTINESKEKKLFSGVFYGFKSKIKIIGRGWKIIKSNYNTLLIKLGYSHPLFLTLSTYNKYKIKKKKKNIMCFMVHFLMN